MGSQGAMEGRQVAVGDERQDMWRVHLDRKEYAAALGFCRGTEQRDQVYAVQVLRPKTLKPQNPKTPKPQNPQTLKP